MAKVKRVYYDGALIYPLTVTDAVIDAETKEQLSAVLQKLQATSYGIITESELKDIINNEDS